jgi:hypothetical protein
MTKQILRNVGKSSPRCQLQIFIGQPPLLRDEQRRGISDMVRPSFSGDSPIDDLARLEYNAGTRRHNS